jgi:DNA-directed RNA polymerase specialized sigma24 family protein
MQDRELVAAILKGEPDALAEAYDRYGAPLYGYCRSMLPEPHSPGEAADAVADTFTVATAKLQGLRDPDQLGAWLRAVARNECLRRLGTAGVAADGAAGSASAEAAWLAVSDGPGLAVSDGTELVAAAEVSPPGSLRERVLQGGADNSPTGRAHRASVTHRAGAFGPTGFPKPVIPPGPRWWHGVRRRPRAAAAVAAVALAVVAGGIAALLVAGGTHRAHASTVALGGSTFATAGAPSVAASSQPAGRPSPSRAPTPAPGSPGTQTSPADGPTPGLATPPGTPRSSAPARGSPSPSPSPSASPSPSPSASPSPSPSPPPPPPGTLQVTPRRIVLSAPVGKPASATFLITAVGGPVSFVVTSPNAHVTVSPPSGSLTAAGSWVTVSVTVRSKVALNVRLMVNPGALVVTVVFSIKA